MSSAAVLQYIEAKEKELGVTPEPKLAEMMHLLVSQNKGHSIMVLIMWVHQLVTSDSAYLLP